MAMTPSKLVQAEGAVHPLEQMVLDIELELDSLGKSLLQRDSAALEASAQALQRKLAEAVQGYRDALANGGLPPELRQRLKRASGEVVRHREALLRASVALDRALDALMPGARGAPESAIYNDQARMNGLNTGRPFCA